MVDCLSCKSNSGQLRISPGCTIYEGSYWLVEHAYPCGLLGWLVIVLKRHCEKLHELTKEEWDELSMLQYGAVNVLNKLLDTQKEYSCCFAEGEGFNHVHFHIVPKTKDFNEHYKGGRVFYYLKEEFCRSVPVQEVIFFCKSASVEIEKYISEKASVRPVETG